jgi:predicted transcriptional regulator
LEASHGNPEAIAELRKEIGHLRTRAENLDSEVKQKDKDIEQMKKRLDEQYHVYNTSQKVEDKLKVCFLVFISVKSFKHFLKRFVLNENKMIKKFI